MADRDPPVCERVCSPALLGHMLSMQLEEEADIAEDGALRIEGDGSARRVVEDVQDRWIHGEDICITAEEEGEYVNCGGVGAEEGATLGLIQGFVHIDAHTRGRLNGVFDVLTGIAVTERADFFDVEGFRRGEEGLGSVIAAGLDCLVEVGG